MMRQFLRLLMATLPVAAISIIAWSSTVSADDRIPMIDAHSQIDHLVNLDEPGVLAWTQTWIRAGFDALEEMLAGSERTGAFCFGERPGLADCCLVPQVASARRFKVPLDGYPNISAINADCMAMDEFASAAPENQPDHES